MKSLNTLFTILAAILLTAGSISAQYVTVGTATGTNTTTGQSPINIWFRSLHYQTIYTVAELQAAGFAPGASIQEIGWDVTGAPSNALPNYTIAMGHTTNTTSGAANYVVSSTLTQVYNNPLYAPTAGGFDMLTLNVPFVWNGTDNIVVDVCFDQVSAYNASGQVSTYTSTNGSTSNRSDSAPQCGLTTTASHAWKPVAQFFIVNGTPPTCAMINNDLAATNVTAYTADLSWTHPGTPASYIIEYGPTGFAPGTGTITTSTTSPVLLPTLNPAQDYTARVQAVCGTAVGDTSYARGVNFTTLCATFMAPYTENFGTGVTPNCWSQSATLGGPWIFANNAGYDAAGAGDHTGDGSHYAWMDFSGSDTDVVLEMNQIDVSALTSPALSFWHFSYFTNASSANNILRVEASDGAGGWDTITTIQQNAPDWQFKLYDLSTYTYGTNIVTIRFIAVQDPTGGTYFYNDLLIDDIKIDEMPTAACAPIMAPDTMDFEDAGILNACWEQDSLDNFDWTVHMGATPSGVTGPSAAHSGSYYAYIESSGATVTGGDYATLISPPINTAALADAPALYFNYHMYGNDSMALRVEYEVFGSDYWVTVWEKMGQEQGAQTDAYSSAYIPLPNAIGSIIRLRFTGITAPNDTWKSDVAIDGIRIQNVLADDIAITNVFTPGSTCGLGVQPVTVEVTNRGFNPQSNVPVFVSVNGGTAVGAIVSGTIAPNGGTATVDVLVDMTALGGYMIDANVVLPGDEVPTNDAMQTTAYHQPHIIGQYDELFEGNDGYWHAEGNWEHGVPSGSVINTAGAGTEAFVTNLTGNYTDGQMNYLYSPCFDISSMTTPVLRFSINWDIEDDSDGAWLDYSTDGGTTWTKLGANSFAGNNWYNDTVATYGWVWSGTGADGSNGWLDAIIDLQPYALTTGTDVRFRFVLATDGTGANEGLGIDNFGLYDGCLTTVANETIVNESVNGMSDGSITLAPVGGFGGYSFMWSDGSTSSSLSGLAPGTYDVTITDQATCTSTHSFTVMSLCPVSLGVSTTSNPTIGDGTSDGSASISVTGGTAPYTYAWSDGAMDDQNFDLAAGDYTVVVTDATGCTDTAMVTVGTNYLMSTDGIEGLTGLTLSPNPAKDYAQLNVTFESAVDLTVNVVDVAGRVLETRHAGNTTSEQMRFDVSNLAEGVYFMQITANGQTGTQRFVVIK